MLDLIYLIGAVITLVIGFSIGSYELIYEDNEDGFLFMIVGLFICLVWPLALIGIVGAWIINKILNKYKI